MMQNSLVTPKDSVKIGASSLLSKLPNLLIGLIIFFSATQFGLHFWPLSSLVYGIRIDYLAPTLYFLDVLIVLYLSLQGLTLKEVPNRETYKARKVRPYWNLITERTDLNGTMRLLLPLLLTNLLYSQNPLATLSWSLHFLLYYLFLRRLLDRRPGQRLSLPGSDLLPERSVLKRKTWLQAKLGSAGTSSAIALEKCLQKRSILGGQTERTDLNGTLRFALTLSVLFQTILALTQVFLGHSAGGLLYYLGERSISVGSPGIALATFMDHVVLRAYGTFSHPNILAGYAVISLLIILHLRGSSSQARFPLGSDLLSKTRLSGLFSRTSKTSSTSPFSLLTSHLPLLPLLLTALLVLLTQSRSAALSLFGLIIPIYFIKNLKPRIIYFVILFSLLTFHFSLVSPARSDLSTTQRLDLQGLSLKVISTYPIFGTGADASISTYASLSPNTRLLQPDHNSFTLFLSWFGLFGVLSLGSDLLSKTRLSGLFSRTSKTSSTSPFSLLTSHLPILPLLLLDHYLLSSPQGLFIILLYCFLLCPDYGIQTINLQRQ